MEWTTWTPVLTLPLGALTILFLHRVPKLGLGKAKTRENDNHRKDLDSQTFRLQGIPATIEGHDTIRKDIKKLVREAYDVERNIQISVRSLASHPIRKGEKVATLSFSRTPLRLAKTPKTVREFDCIPPFTVRLDIHFHGITPLHSHDEPECDLAIVALSGLNGHAFGAFKRKGGDYMWLRDDLCHALPHVRVYIYGYKTDREGSESFQSLDDLGLSFKSTLKAILKSKDNDRSSNPLVLIGHSLGGLVIKQALCQMSESKAVGERSILKSIQGIMFFGTPNQGMDIPSLLSMTQGQSNDGFVRSLGLDSTELRQQTKQWFHVFQLREGDKVSSALEIISFYETKNSPTAIKVDGKWRMGGRPAKLVDRNSATHGRPFDSDEHYVQPICRSHSELVRFQSSTDEIYNEKVLPLLKNFYETAKDRSPVLLLSQAQQKALERCRSSLSSSWEQTRAGQIVVAENSTCTWFSKHPIYEDWLRQRRSLLWLQGLPGAGKSTIMKHVVESTQKNPPKDAAIASFFIYGLGIDLQKTLRGLYCSLIRQLLPQVPFAFLPILAKAEDIHDPASLGPLDLQKYFKQALVEVSKTRPVILFIDALNEFSTANEERETLLDVLRDLCYGKKESSLRINICVSSRYYPNLYNRGLIIPVEQNNHNDVIAFVQYSLQDFPEEMKLPLTEYIIDKANGVFQWVRLVCKEARELHRKGKKLSVIMSNTAAIPLDLHLLYDELFEEMTGNDMSESLKLFRWVGFSKRMITLRELQHALALAPDMKEQSVEECSKSDNFLDRLEDLKNSITDLSKGLVGFEGAHERDGDQAWGERVRLIHVTVMDYLCDRGLKILEKGTKSEDIPPEGAAHYYITRSSFRYMFMRGTREDFDTRQMSSSRFPLDHLVQTSIEYHLQSAEQYGVDQFELLRIFGWPNEKNAIASFRTFVTRFNESPLIHILAACGVLSALRALIYYSPEDQATTNHNAEIDSLVSARQGEILPDDVFLPSGQVNLDIMNGLNDTPLHFALVFEKPEAAHELLRSNRVNANALNFYRRTPLHVAANTGMIAAVQHLLNHPAVNPNAQDASGQTALHNAIDGSKEDVIKLLLQNKKVNQNARDKDGRTPLHLAAKAADIDIVDILLQSGTVDVNIKDNKGQTPLFAFILGYAGYGADASEHGELADVLLRLLSHPKTQPRSRDKMQRTPLFYAATEGLELFARILVDGGRGGAADKDKLGRTPLSQAAAKGHEGIVRRFLATEEFDEEDLQFAYQEAKKKGRKEIMRRLVDTGRLIES